MAQVIWTESSLDDLSQIADYIALDDPQAARRLVRRVFAKAALLQDFPEIGPIPRDLPNTRYRHLVIKPLRLFYRIEDATIFVIYIMRSERLLKLSDLSDREESGP